jgi:hypothetical protein
MKRLMSRRVLEMMSGWAHLDTRTEAKQLPLPARAGRGPGRGDLSLKTLAFSLPTLSSFGRGAGEEMAPVSRYALNGWSRGMALTLLPIRSVVCRMARP